MRRRRIPACWKEASSSLVVLLLPGIFLNRHTEERRFPAYSLEMRSRHPAKTSLFRLSSLWLLAFRLDKRLTSLPSLDERAAAARSLFPLFSPPVGWWSPFFMMNGFVLLLLPHNPPSSPVLRIATYVHFCYYSTDSFFSFVASTANSVPGAAAAINESRWLRIPRGPERKS